MPTLTPLPISLARPLAVAQAREHGVSPRRLRAPDLTRPFRGVVCTRQLDFVGRCHAYMQRLPPGGFVSGPTAARLYGVPLPAELERDDAPLDVSVPAPGRAPRVSGVRGHSVRIHFGDVSSVAGVPASAPARWWCELSSHLDVETLVTVGDALLHRRLGGTRLDGLAAAVDRYPSRRWRRRLVEALPLLDDRAESPQESRLRTRLVRAGVSGMIANPTITTATGRVYRGDLTFPEQRVILEYQGDVHRPVHRFRADMTRQLDLQADGWTVVYLGPGDLADDQLVRRVRAILALHTAPPPSPPS